MAIRRSLVFLVLPIAFAGWTLHRLESIPKSQATDSRPDSARTHYEVGLSCMKEGKFDKAAENFRQAISRRHTTGQSRTQYRSAC